MRKVVAVGTAFAFAVGTLVGCAEKSDRIPVSKVSGKLVRTGAPLTGLSVTFHPADGNTPATPTRPFGIVNAEGSFRLTSYLKDDGAPPGEYVVTIGEAPRGDGAGVPRAILPNAKFLDPKTSPLRVRVESAPSNELAPFDISN